MKKLIIALLILSGCTPINSIENFKGSVVVEKKIYKNQLGEPISYIYTIRETVNGRRGLSYRIISFEVVEYEYDLYNVGDTIKQCIMQTITIKVPNDCEVQVVKKEPIIKTYQDLIHYKEEIKGYWVGVNGEVIPCYSDNLGTFSKIIAASEKVAKSMLAMAMISQLMPYYGGAITDEEWKGTKCKYIITLYQGETIKLDWTLGNYYFLAFHTSVQRGEFLKYNEQLVKDYLMID